MSNAGPQSTELPYQFIFENAFEAIAILEGDGVPPRLNRAARGLAGLDVGKLFSTEGALHPLLGELETQGRASTTLRVTSTFAEPRRYEVEGAVHGSHRIISIRDVTREDERDAELDHLRRVESLGFLTASVVHDFNNLLTPIVCLSALLVRELAAGTRPHEMAKDIRDAAEKAAALSRQVLGSARRAPSEPARVDVNVVLAELQALLELVVGDEIDVVLSLDDTSCEIVVIRERLEHVLFNLVANARDAMPRGGTITLRSTNVPHGESVAIVVTDTGVGMSAEVRQRAFERFFTTKDRGFGTGLGLFHAHRFAAENQGQISLHSDLGKGTKIMLQLPCAPLDPATATSSASEIPRGTETVLVADDDRRVAAVVSEVLRGLGYHVIVAGSGDDALAKARAHEGEIDLVLADLVTPKTDDRPLVDRLREILPVKRVLFMSGHTDRVLDGRNAGQPPPARLRKAFTPAELALRVREALDAPATA